MGSETLKTTCLITNFSFLILICRIQIRSQKMFQCAGFPKNGPERSKNAVFGGFRGPQVPTGRVIEFFVFL